MLALAQPKADSSGRPAEQAAPDIDLAALLEGMGAEVALLDGGGQILYVNAAWHEFGRRNGRPRSEGPPRDNYLAVCDTAAAAGDAVAARVAAGLREVLDGRLPKFEIDYPCFGPQERHWFRMQAQRLAPTPARVLVWHVDISDTYARLLAHQQALTEAAQSSQAVLEHIVDGVISISAQGLVQSFNRAAGAMFGYASSEVVGHNISMLMPAAESAQHDQFLARRSPEPHNPVLGQTRELRGRRKNGEIFPLSLSVSRTQQAGQPVYISVIRDLSRLRRDAAEIRRLAYFDPLTGLPNRRLFHDRVKSALHHAARSGQHGALLFLDLDHFKLHNDTLGHAVGDDLLIAVAHRLREALGDSAIVGRLGGDEFVLLLDGLSPSTPEAARQVEQIGAKLLGAVAAPHQLGEQTLLCTASLGAAVFPHGQDKPNDLLRHAELAMYQAKAGGRNSLQFYEEGMQAALLNHAELKSDLRRALAAGEFSLHYQIQVRADGEVFGAEALLRWQHPKRGPVSPAVFVPMAEESGTILALGEWVLETACRQLVAWSLDPHTQAWCMAVNVSACQFAQPGFVEQVLAVIERTGARPDRLKLELTESMLAKDVDDIGRKMHLLRAHRVGFSLDDFGTGYSSLAYLKRLPLSQLKIDRAFVRDLPADPGDAVIARTVIALGQSLGLVVVAEGVETEAQRAFLAEAGCHAFQGYLFGRPVPATLLGCSQHAGQRQAEQAQGNHHPVQRRQQD